MALLKRRKLLIALAVVALFGGITWWQRTPLLAWYYVRQLAAADDAERDTWARRVADLHPGQWHDTCRDLALRSLQEAEPAQRVLAVNLALKIARRSDAEILAKVVPLLRDAAAEVRRAAMLAVGASRQVIADDDLLPFLHDADAEVRRLCELALRSRGLQENHLILARLITHQDPAARLQVIDHLKLAPELEPSVWLRRMTEDANPAVRAAAIRAACRDFPVDLGERIRQMALSDDSETVRNIARTQLEMKRCD